MNPNRYHMMVWKSTRGHWCVAEGRNGVVASYPEQFTTFEEALANALEYAGV